MTARSRNGRGCKRTGAVRKPGSVNRETALKQALQKRLIDKAAGKEVLALPSTSKPDKPAELAKRLPPRAITRDEATGAFNVLAPIAEKAFGSDSVRDEMATVFLTQLCNVSICDWLDDLEAAKFCINTAASIGPRDAVETMLVVQMIGTHNRAMELLRTTQPSNAARLLRVYAAQVVALRDYRRKGEQRVTIEHVSVGAGGQAIVGQVVTGGEKK